MGDLRAFRVQPVLAVLCGSFQRFRIFSHARFGFCSSGIRLWPSTFLALSFSCRPSCSPVTFRLSVEASSTASKQYFRREAFHSVFESEVYAQEMGGWGALSFGGEAGVRV